jgi:hypothetical protein
VKIECFRCEEIVTISQIIHQFCSAYSWILHSSGLNWSSEGRQRMLATKFTIPLEDKMFKKMLIFGLVGVVVAAAAFSLYNARTASAAQINAPVQANSQGQGQGNGAGNSQANGGGYGRSENRSSNTAQGSRANIGTSSPQNGFTEWVTFTGTVSQYSGPQFTLLTADGQSIPAEPGNISYQAEIGLALKDGDTVTVTGFWDANGGLALGSLTLESSGETFNFRDDLGRPLWSGGRSRGYQQP